MSGEGSPRGGKRHRALETNNNGQTKRPRMTSPCTAPAKEAMQKVYQPWVVRTYGDLAKTKTVTLAKYARIVRTLLGGGETPNADNSKFRSVSSPFDGQQSNNTDNGCRFWVRAKGFHVGVPPGYEARPADSIVGRHSVCDSDSSIRPEQQERLGSARDPPLYVPSQPFKVSLLCTSEHRPFVTRLVLGHL